MPSAEHGAGFLAVASSEIATQWVRPVHAKDKNKTPENTSVGSEVRVLWRCNKNPEHTWEARVNDRTRGNGCPIHADTGWGKDYLIHFLKHNLNILEQTPDEHERRLLFESSRAVINTSPTRAIIENIIQRKLSERDIQAYINRTVTPNIQKILDQHSPRDYNGKDHILLSLRREVYARDGHVCLACGTSTRLSCDHYPIPEILEGPTTLENLRTLCRSCNSISGVKALSIADIQSRLQLRSKTPTQF